MTMGPQDGGSQLEVPARLSMDAALHAFERAIQHADVRAGIAPLRNPIREVCVAARHEGMLPERLIIRLKAAMRPLQSPLSDPLDRADDLRNRLILIAIDDYFANDR